MLQIGITGGIGSGKTTVCQIFAAFGIPIYDADSAAKKLMSEDLQLIESIKELFGEMAYAENGELNRSYIAEKAFVDKDLIKKLNNIVHPAVAIDQEKWTNVQKSPYVIKEAALLYESGSYQKLDKVIVVTAPEELRIERVMKRNQISREAVLARMQQQWPEEEKIRLADYIINNDGELPLIPQCMAIHHQLLNLATTF
jgi:dephospho-CoA kinase